MRHRNSIFGSLSLVVAGAAIGGGALVSSSAMADDGTPQDTGTMEVVMMTSDMTEPIKCTFDDVPLPSEPASILVGADTSSAVADGGVVAVSGSGPVLTAGAPGDAGPSIVVSGSATVSGAGGEDGTFEVHTITPDDIDQLAPVGEGVPAPPDGTLTVISSDDARQGTAEECAAMRADMPTP